MGDSVIDLGMKEEGHNIPFKLNSSELGPGNYKVFASIVTTVPRARDGESPVLILRILTKGEWEDLFGRGEEEIEEEGENISVVVPDDVEPEEGNGPKEEDDRFLYTIIIATVLGSIFIISVIILFMVARRRTKEIEGNSYYKPEDRSEKKFKGNGSKTGEPKSIVSKEEKNKRWIKPITNPRRSEIK